MTGFAHEGSGDDLPERGEEPHVVSAFTDRTEDAVVIIEALEREGIPPAAIAVTHNSSVETRRVVGTVGRSVLAGGVLGMIVGGVLGLLVYQAGQLSSRPIAILLGSVFGAAIGVALGGVLAVRYASPAWRRAQTARGATAVVVQHPDVRVVDSAEDVMAAHRPRRLHRVDR